VDDHTGEEDRVEPREWAVETSDQTPGKRKVQVGGVLNLAGVLVPAVAEKRVTGRGLNLLRILDGLPGELRECLAVLLVAAFLAAEHGLLAVTSVPDPVSEEVRSVEQDKNRDAVAVL